MASRRRTQRAFCAAGRRIVGLTSPGSRTPPATSSRWSKTKPAIIKLVYCITRRPGMTLEEFSRDWGEGHAPIGRRIPGLRRLVQSHRVMDPPDLPAFGGMAELCIDVM